MSAASNGLPPGWADTTLGEVASDGVTQGPPTGRGEFTYVDIGCIENGTKRIVDPKRLPVSDAPSRARQLLRAGDVVVSMTRPNLNAVALIDESLDGAIGSSGFHVLRTNAIEPKWVFYRVQTSDFIEAMTSLTQGALYPAVRPKDIIRFATSVPPLSEQRRIVAEIEAQFSRLDAGVAALRRVAANLKRYKAAVLKAACDGSLTADWRAAHPDAEPAGGLLRRILAERRRRWEQAERARLLARGKPPTDDRWKARYEEPPGPKTADLPPLPKTWTWATVEQLAVVVRGSSPRPAGDPRYFGGGYVPWITVGPLTADEDKYLQAVPESLTEAGCDVSRQIEPGTLLLTNSGATLGVPKISLIRGCINDGVAALLEVDDPLKSYLYHFLRTQTLALRGINQGAAQPNLNTGIIRSILVPLPPQDEQTAIVDAVEDAWSIIQAVATAVDSNARRASHLRQAILRDAFAGKLVAQDPADEPAAALLERIRAQPHSSPNPQRTRTPRKPRALRA